jgi:hypothetical protein
VGIFEPFEAGGRTFSGVGCCFCDHHIEPGEIDPVTLTIHARSDRPRDDGLGLHTTWCHAACLEATGIADLHVTQPEFWQDLDGD